jgi:hypothetical protein
MYLRTLIIAGLCLVLPHGVLADEMPADGLAHCAAIDDATTRLDCYDALSGRAQARQEIADAIPETASSPPAGPPDDFGSERIKNSEKSEQEDAEEVEVVARVTRCEKDSRKKFFFYLDGGQVWKQVSDKKLYFRDCDFDVTISKDFFGYKMQRVGEKSRFRVSRVR